MSLGQLLAVMALLCGVGFAVLGALVLSAVARNRVLGGLDRLGAAGSPPAPAGRSSSAGRSGSIRIEPAVHALRLAARPDGGRAQPTARSGAADRPAPQRGHRVACDAQDRAHSYRSANQGVLLHERPAVPAVEVLAVALLLLGLFTLPVALGYGLRSGLLVLLLTMTPSAAAAVAGLLWLRHQRQARAGSLGGPGQAPPQAGWFDGVPSSAGGAG